MSCYFIVKSETLTIPNPVEKQIAELTAPTVATYVSTVESVDTASLPDAAENPTILERLRSDKLGRFIAKASILLGITGGTTAAYAAEAPAAQASSPVYTVTSAAAGGVYSRYAPHVNSTNRTPGFGIYPGDKVELLCGVTDGDAVGPYNNHSWDFVKDLSRQEANFWTSQNYTNSPNTANTLAPGEARCANESSNPLTKTTPTPVQPWNQPTRSVHDRVDHVQWIKTPYGESLHVFVTRSGYLTSFAFPHQAFNEVMYDAHLPYSNAMYNQFACHADLAPPWKQSWNLDSWRPDVGLVKTMKDKCNPL